ncbi:MAG: serine/threonine-protein kinase, partial [Myxococcales bacterium]|nr:serine/threonine-protein kinase [Myxococcales bacterium]
MVQPAPQASEPGTLAAGIPRSGEVIAHKYQIERVLGIGGMGVVLSAIHLHLHQRVAIKMLLPEVASNPESLSRFMREAQAASSIRSEHVTQILDVGILEGPGLPYMVMEFLDGLDLGQYLQRHQRLSIPDAVDYVLQACEAIAYAHRLGVVHRDLKPANLFLTYRADGTPLIKVLDFGISKVTQAGNSVALTATSFAFGTPLYMSPEQVRSAKYVDPRTDIWAMGVILHELIAGRPPFEGETLTALCAAITADPPRPLRRDRPEAPAELEAAILHSLQKDPALRPSSILDFAAAIAPFGSTAAGQLLTSIERIGAVNVPTLPRASGPAVDPHGTHSSWETGRLPSSPSRRWIALAA